MISTLDKIISTEKEKGYEKVSSFLSSSIAEAEELSLFIFPDFDSTLAGSILQLFLLENNLTFKIRLTPRLELEEWKDWSKLIITIGLNIPRSVAEFLGDKKLKTIAFTHSTENLISQPYPSLFRVSVDYHKTTLSTILLRILKELWIPHSKAYLLAIMSGLASRHDRSREGGFTGLENEIVSEAVSKKLVNESLGLKLSSFEDKYLIYSMHDTLNPYLEGVTGDLEGSKKLLEDVGIEDYEDVKVTDLPGDLMSKLVKSLLKKAGSSDKISVGWIIGRVYRVPDVGFVVRDLKDITHLLLLVEEWEGFEKIIVTPLNFQKVISKNYNLLLEAPKKLKIAYDKSLESIGSSSTNKMLVVEGLEALETPLSLLRYALEDHGVVDDSKMLVFYWKGRYYVRLEDVKRTFPNPEVEWEFYDKIEVNSSRGYGVFSGLEVLEVSRS